MYPAKRNRKAGELLSGVEQKRALVGCDSFDLLLTCSVGGVQSKSLVLPMGCGGRPT